MIYEILMFSHQSIDHKVDKFGQKSYTNVFKNYIIPEVGWGVCQKIMMNYNYIIIEFSLAVKTV